MAAAAALRQTLTRRCTTSRPGLTKVAMVGAAGGIGQPLSLLLKNDLSVTELRLHDIKSTRGLAADLTHIPTPAKVKGTNDLPEALEGTDVVIITAGMPRRPGMSREQLFDNNAAAVLEIAGVASRVAPAATFLLVTNPVNATVPIFAEVFRQAGVYDPRKVIGVTTLDVIRAETFVAEQHGGNPLEAEVTVIGGHAGTTILPVRPECRVHAARQTWCEDCWGSCTSIIPLLSQVPGPSFSQEAATRITHHIQHAGDEVVVLNEGKGSATLSMAYAGYRFASAVMRAQRGEEGLTECCFVENDLTEAPFFAAPVTLGRHGVHKVHSFGNLSALEQRALDRVVPELIKQAEQAVKFVKERW